MAPATGALDDVARHLPALGAEDLVELHQAAASLAGGCGRWCSEPTVAHVALLRAGGRNPFTVAQRFTEPLLEGLPHLLIHAGK